MTSQMQDTREDLARPGAQHPDAYTNSGSVVQCGAWTSPLACNLPFLRLGFSYSQFLNMMVVRSFELTSPTHWHRPSRCDGGWATLPHGVTIGRCTKIDSQCRDFCRVSCVNARSTVRSDPLRRISQRGMQRAGGRPPPACRRMLPPARARARPERERAAL